MYTNHHNIKQDSIISMLQTMRNRLRNNRKTSINSLLEIRNGKKGLLEFNFLEPTYLSAKEVVVL